MSFPDGASLDPSKKFENSRFLDNYSRMGTEGLIVIEGGHFVLKKQGEVAAGRDLPFDKAVEILEASCTDKDLQNDTVLNRINEMRARTRILPLQNKEELPKIRELREGAGSLVKEMSIMIKDMATNKSSVYWNPQVFRTNFNDHLTGVVDYMSQLNQAYADGQISTKDYVALRENLLTGIVKSGEAGINNKLITKEDWVHAQGQLGPLTLEDPLQFCQKEEIFSHHLSTQRSPNNFLIRGEEVLDLMAHFQKMQKLGVISTQGFNTIAGGLINVAQKLIAEGEKYSAVDTRVKARQEKLQQKIELLVQKIKELTPKSEPRLPPQQFTAALSEEVAKGQGKTLKERIDSVLVEGERKLHLAKKPKDFQPLFVGYTHTLVNLLSDIHQAHALGKLTDREYSFQANRVLRNFDTMKIFASEKKFLTDGILSKIKNSMTCLEEVWPALLKLQSEIKSSPPSAADFVARGNKIMELGKLLQTLPKDYRDTYKTGMEILISLTNHLLSEVPMGEGVEQMRVLLNALLQQHKP